MDGEREAGTLTADELAALVGDGAERIAQLTASGVITPDADGRYAPGDAHRVRVVDGFEAAGLPLEVLIRAQDAGLISIAYYDELHPPPGRPSERTFRAFLDALGSKGELVGASLGAMGIAAPDPTSRLTVEDEAFLTELATMMESAGEVDLMLRMLRQFGEATRRASVGALETYAEPIERLGPEFAGVPSRAVYDQYFLPWARIARSVPGMAEWLTSKHLTRAIDAYSIEATEAMLADSASSRGGPEATRRSPSPISPASPRSPRSAATRPPRRLR